MWLLFSWQLPELLLPGIGAELKARVSTWNLTFPRLRDWRDSKFPYNGNKHHRSCVSVLLLYRALAV